MNEGKVGQLRSKIERAIADGVVTRDQLAAAPEVGVQAEYVGQVDLHEVGIAILMAKVMSGFPL